MATRTYRLAALSLLILIGSLSTVRVTAHDWPIFHGPQHNNISSERHWGEDWANCSLKVRWTRTVGMGASAVVVADGRLYTLGNSKILNKDTDTIYCLDPNSGTQVWSYSYPAALGAHLYEGGTTTTPTVVGDKAYTLNKQGLAYCFDAETGAVLWQVDLVAKHGVRTPTWSFTGSPYPYGDLVVYNVGTHGLALHAADGTLAWTTGTDVSGYSTPVPLDDNGQPLLVLMGYRTFAAVEPMTGRVAWEYPWVNALPGNIADPVVDGNELFVSSGYNKGSALFRASGGQVTQVWLQRSMQTCYNTAVLWQGYLYGPNDGGSNLTCLEFSTGKVIWNKGGFGRACVSLADATLIVLSETGELSIGKASPVGYTPAVRAQILTGECRTVPVLANGKIYVRSTAGSLACVELTTSAPRVDAGSSVLTWLKAGETTVVLNGSVADDTNDVTGIRWSALSSPDGSLVEFADSSKPATTARFTGLGLYILELYAIDAESQEGHDRIEVRVYADADEAANNRPAGSSVAAWHDSDADLAEDPNDASLTEDVYYDAGRITLPAH